MIKLTKIWKLTDQITNLEQVFNCRDDACDFEHSDTIIEEGYFISKEGLVRVINAAAASESLGFPIKAIEKMILSELGVGDGK